MKKIIITTTESELSQTVDSYLERGFYAQKINSIPSGARILDKQEHVVVTILINK